MNPIQRLAAVSRALRKGARTIHRALAGLQRKALHPAPDPTPVELDPSSPPLETIYQQAVGANARIIGLTGVDHDNGVSTIARALTRRAALGGRRALLVNAASTSAADTVDGDETESPSGLETILLRPTSEATLRMRDLEFLRNKLHAMLGHYDLLIIDMAPPLRDPRYPIPATILAKVCDQTYLVCLTGRVTEGDLQSAIDELISNSCRVSGVVINHREQPTLSAEMAREAERLRRIAPSLVKNFQRRVMTSKFLNVHA